MSALRAGAVSVGAAAITARPAMLRAAAMLWESTMVRGLAALLVAAAMLAGCKSLPVAPPAPSEPWEVRRAALQARNNFDLNGRIAVAAAQEGFNAKLRWEQKGTLSQLALDGPLGVGGVRITSDGKFLSVMNSRGEQLDSEAARREIEAKLGFEPPFASLRYWVLGVPDPSSPADEQLDESKRLASLSQDGWQIDYGGYTDAGGQTLPSKVTLKRENVRVRLVVDGWGT
jgi:outer membrane lipoprotein LolB